MYRHQWRLNSYFRMWRVRWHHPDLRKKLKTAMFNSGLVLKLSVSRVTFNLLFGLNRFFAKNRFSPNNKLNVTLDTDNFKTKPELNIAVFNFFLKSGWCQRTRHMRK